MATGLGCDKRRLVLKRRHERTLSSALLGGSGRATYMEGRISYSWGKESRDSVGGGLRPPNMLS